jgi:hypothetical protein
MPVRSGSSDQFCHSCLPLWNYINENYILLTERSRKEDLNINEIKEENTGKLKYETFAKCEAKF